MMLPSYVGIPIKQPVEWKVRFFFVAQLVVLVMGGGLPSLKFNGWFTWKSSIYKWKIIGTKPSLLVFSEGSCWCTFFRMFLMFQSFQVEIKYCNQHQSSPMENGIHQFELFSVELKNSGKSLLSQGIATNQNFQRTQDLRQNNNNETTLKHWNTVDGRNATSWYGKYPIIYRVLYIPNGGCFGFLNPWTVSITSSSEKLQVPDKFASTLVMEQLTCSGVFEAANETIIVAATVRGRGETGAIHFCIFWSWWVISVISDGSFIFGTIWGEIELDANIWSHWDISAWCIVWVCVM